METMFFFTGIFLTASIYLLLSDLLKMPSLANTRAALKLTQGKKSRGIKALTLRASTELSKHIRLDSYRRRTMLATLQYAEINLTPETYLSNAIVKAAFRCLLIIPLAFVAPFVIPLVIIWGISGFWDSTKQAKIVVAEKRRKIDEELPRFVSTISEELHASRDVLSIIEGYLPSAGKVFKNELEIAVADMRSGSTQQALNRLAGRVGSSMLSQIVRGLVSVTQGDNGVVYFTLLAHDYQRLDIQQLEKDAKKRPGQTKKYSYAMLACFLVIFIFVIFQQMYRSTGSLS